ncbi:MAG: ABC transporter ATP-binding protein [Anaerolineae bacterium]|jgi:ABC-type Fe3+/spermidine/putrescine transport system ATPase subunit|nr:ABC transporter ATP-binding protein [Anaerolineae bacterium]
MLQLNGINRSFDDQPILQSLDLTVNDGEIVCLLGASGSGKTTLLRVIAGLETLDSGDLSLDGVSIRDLPVYRRDFGLMFQDFALFPHLNVAQNVLFGLKMRGTSHTLQTQRLTEVLALVGLSGFERRSVTELSGGERQRVALARSLAPRPRLLLLDEPMGSLDAALRERLMIEVRDIIKAAGITAIAVTHDQQEAFTIADRIGVIHHGQIEQIDTPSALYQRPKTTYIAQFLGLHNLIPVLEAQDGIATTPIGSFVIERPAQALLLHPDSVKMNPTDGITVIVRRCWFRGDHYQLQVEHQSGITLMFRQPVPLPLGDAVRITFDRVIPLEA